jgi:uncharacterized protein
MLVNVAQLLKEPVGSTRNLNIDECIDETGEISKQNVTGALVIIRIDKGILVQGKLYAARQGNCARCLKPIDYTYEFNIAEEFVPTIDINTQMAVEVQDDAFTIDSRHNIDLSELLYQYTSIARPMKTLCREDCAGICPVCGQDLNNGKCNCVADNDTRWLKLKNLKKEGK